ncbi:MAG: amino acid kinase [Methanohalobium sp.]|uniref:amino acid kinase family protein n=1 Tax=Methanohalobium sp. TaxID=2837493 RepID=UPI00397DE570
MRIVLKIGGSLMDNINTITNHILDYINNTAPEETSIIIVPGGGLFADCIRSVSKKYSISNESSHWMAIAGMEQYAYYIIDKTGLRNINSLSNVKPGVSVLKPYQFLRINDELPHGWNVTSDSIGAWIAKKLDSLFIKVTDVDGIFQNHSLVPEIDASDISKLDQSCTDEYMPGFLKEKQMNCYIVNGHYPERIVAVIKDEPVVGTYIKGNI